MFTMKMNASIALGCFLQWFSVLGGVILNAHCVEVSLVNNDASSSLVYTL